MTSLLTSTHLTSPQLFSPSALDLPLLLVFLPANYIYPYSFKQHCCGLSVYKELKIISVPFSLTIRDSFAASESPIFYIGPPRLASPPVLPHSCEYSLTASCVKAAVIFNPIAITKRGWP